MSSRLFAFTAANITAGAAVLADYKAVAVKQSSHSVSGTEKRLGQPNQFLVWQLVSISRHEYSDTLQGNLDLRTPPTGSRPLHARSGAVESYPYHRSQ